MNNIFTFDLDNTICVTDNSDYKNSKPIKTVINLINDLKEKGNKIIIFTARGAKSKIDWSSFTKNQIDSWGLKYDELICNKKHDSDFFIDDKNISINEILNILKPYNVGFTCGRFDLIHSGHIKLFKEAKKQCSKLVVAIQIDNSDNGGKKTILPIEERFEILDSIKYIDQVIKYKTENELSLIISQINPDVRFLGEDYKNKKITGLEFCKNIVFINRNENDISSTKIKRKIFDYENL